MRKLRTLLAAIAALALLVPAAATADPIQSITAKLIPKKLPKKRYKPAKIYVEILTKDNTTDPVHPNQPPSAYNTKVNFPRNMKFNTRKAKRCKATEAELQNTTADQAVSLCGRKSVVSKGSKLPSDPPGRNHTNGTSAWVTADFGALVGQIPVQVTAFNGHKKNTLFLHSYAPSANNTSVLVGKLKKAPKGYGRQLDVTIPPLLAGAISRFTTTVKKGKYVQARCKPRKMRFQAITKYDNHPQTSDKYKQKCKVKKGKKGKRRHAHRR